MKHIVKEWQIEVREGPIGEQLRSDPSVVDASKSSWAVLLAKQFGIPLLLFKTTDEETAAYYRLKGCNVHAVE